MSDNGFESMNVIPLVDVMLVLLTIVLTTSTFIATGSIPIALPRAAAGGAEASRARAVEIDRQGHLFLEGQPVTIAGLEKGLAHEDRALAILIRADREVVLQPFVEVMDTVKRLGFARVSLQTEVAP